MQNVSSSWKRRMLAVLGCTIEEIINFIKNIKKEVCEIANDNSKGQIIVSGDNNALWNLKN